MELNVNKEGAHITIALSGELNTLTAPALSECIDANINDLDCLTLDFAECDYVSSAGLRVLLSTFKTLKPKNASMKLTNVGPNFLDVLENTNLDAVFDYETR